MNKALSIFFLTAFAAGAIGQETQPPVKRPAAKTVKSSPKKQSFTASKQKPSPAATPVDPEADRKRFDEALAAATTAEKARLLRAFIDEFPSSEHREEAFSYLISARAISGNEMIQSGDTAAGIASFKLAVEEAPSPVPDRLFNDVVSKIPVSLFYRDQRPAAMELAQLIEKKVAASPKQLLGIAAFYLGIENGAEAKRVAEAAIALEPTSAAGYQALGLAHRLNFDLEDAAKAYAKAVEVDAASVPARRSLAEMNRALGKPAEAVTIYREIVTATEGDAIARQGLVLSLFDAGQQKEAETELARAIENDARNFSLITSVAYWYAANSQAEKAVEYGQKAVEIEPRYIWGHIALARGLMKRNKPVDAERALIRARQYGNFPTLDYEIASARFMAGLYREAAEELQKSFSLKDGMIGTRLGGRVYKEEKNFQDLIAHERKASLLQPLPADNADASAKLRLLMELTKKANDADDEAELVALTDEFVKGDDKMKLHRQLFAANLLLQKNVALPKAAELVKASVSNVDAGLDVSAPAAAVMASELYESRTVAFSRNEVILIPEVPRQTLSAILRGRIEELAGWTLYQQKSYPEAVVRLRRAISVLPDKSAWWRSSMWRLGAALEADGKDKEALDSYIKSYVTDRPSQLRYSVIESLYRKMNGSTDGLEEKIGANPYAAVATASSAPAEQPKPEPSPEEKPKTVDSSPAKTAEPVQKMPRNVPMKTETAEVNKSTVTAVETGKPDEKSVEPEKSAIPVNIKGEKAKADQTLEKTELPAAVPPPSPTVEEKRVPENSSTPLGDPLKASVEKTDKPLTEEQKVKTAEKSKDVAAELTDPKAETSTPVQVSNKNEDPIIEIKPATVKSDEQKPPEAAPVTKPPDTVKTEPDPPKLESQSVEMPAVKAEPKSADPAKAEKSSGDQTDTGPPKPAAAENDPKKVPPEPSAKTEKQTNDAPEREPSNLLRDPFATPEPETKPPAASERKPLIIINDPFKPAEKSSKNRELFEPVIIKVPSGTASAQKPKVSDAENQTTSSGAIRRRLVDGKEVLSDQQCSIELSQDNVQLLSGGGSIGIRVSVNGDAEGEITASSSSAKDIEVRAEPKIDGTSGRRFYVIKSISDRVGIFQVNFESPCGKREVIVHVR